jgi:hypothetical protein
LTQIRRTSVIKRSKASRLDLLSNDLHVCLATSAQSPQRGLKASTPQRITPTRVGVLLEDRHANEIPSFSTHSELFKLHCRQDCRMKMRTIYSEKEANGRWHSCHQGETSLECEYACTALIDSSSRSSDLSKTTPKSNADNFAGHLPL